ncbi:MAG TPA: ATP-binding protein [Steroidobacteraceae bacterium]|nr:ATP-binding protein [Steroidobacteraceae bacterium]
MKERTMSAGPYSLGIALRAALLGAGAFAILQLLATQRLYATALVVAAVAAVLVFELRRHVARSDRMLAQFVAGLAVGDFERPSRDAAATRGFRRLAAAIDRAATALSASRVSQQRQVESLQALLDTSAVAMLIVEPSGSVTLANRAARQLAGVPVASLAQLPAFGPAAAELQELAPGRRKVVRLANGQRMLASASQFIAGGVAQRVLSLQNIGSELDEAELQAWHDLVRILAHEMMNSLTPIASLAESVRPLVAAMRTDTGAGGDRHVADVAGAIDTIARRSAGLMSFVERYRKMAERPQPVLRAVRVASLVQKVEQLMSAVFSGKGIAFMAHIEPPELAVRADAAMLEQALLNLLHNSVDALVQTADARIEVRARLETDGVAIAVLDNGPGIPADALERIFVPFFTTKAGGSGIGLSLARQIAHAHGGRLDASANAPSGAAFTLFLPVPPQ